MAEVFHCKPEIGIQKLVSHQRILSGDTLLVDSVQDANESGASCLFHDWLSSQFFVEGGVANMIYLLVRPSDNSIGLCYQEPLKSESSSEKGKKKK